MLLYHMIWYLRRMIWLNLLKILPIPPSMQQCKLFLCLTILKFDLLHVLRFVTAPLFFLIDLTFIFQSTLSSSCELHMILDCLIRIGMKVIFGFSTISKWPVKLTSFIPMSRVFFILFHSNLERKISLFY
mgnify:CR=1 FL=1